MKVHARRGVCIGVNQHLKHGDIVDLDAALSTYLIGIGAVEPYVEPAPEAEHKAKPKVSEHETPIRESFGKKEK